MLKSKTCLIGTPCFVVVGVYLHRKTTTNLWWWSDHILWPISAENLEIANSVISFSLQLYDSAALASYKWEVLNWTLSKQSHDNCITQRYKRRGNEGPDVLILLINILYIHGALYIQQKKSGLYSNHSFYNAVGFMWVFAAFIFAGLLACLNIYDYHRERE